MHFLNKGGQFSTSRSIPSIAVHYSRLWLMFIPLTLMFCYIFSISVICLCYLQFVIILFPMYLKLSFHFITRQLYFYLFHAPDFLLIFINPQHIGKLRAVVYLQGKLIHHLNIKTVPCHQQQQEHVPVETVVAVLW
jgi:hypothetical protein